MLKICKILKRRMCIVKKNYRRRVLNPPLFLAKVLLNFENIKYREGKLRWVVGRGGDVVAKLPCTE